MSLWSFWSKLRAGLLRKTFFIVVFGWFSLTSVFSEPAFDLDSVEVERRVIQFLELPYYYPCDLETQETVIAVDELYILDGNIVESSVRQVKDHWNALKSKTTLDFQSEMQKFQMIVGDILAQTKDSGRSERIFRHAFREVRQNVRYRLDTKQLPPQSFGVYPDDSLIAFSSSDIIKPVEMLRAVRLDTNSTYRKVWSSLSDDMKKAVVDCEIGGQKGFVQARDGIIEALNRLIASPVRLSDEPAFSGVSPRRALDAVGGSSPSSRFDIARFNRIILEDAFPTLVAKLPGEFWAVPDWYDINDVNLQDASTNGFLAVSVQPKPRYAVVQNDYSRMTRDQEIFKNIYVLPAEWTAFALLNTVDKEHVKLVASTNGNWNRAFRNPGHLFRPDRDRVNQLLPSHGGGISATLSRFGTQGDLFEFNWESPTDSGLRESYRLVCIRGDPLKAVYGITFGKGGVVDGLTWWVRNGPEGNAPKLFFYAQRKPNGEISLRLQKIMYSSISRADPEEFQFQDAPEKWSSFWDKRPAVPVYYKDGQIVKTKARSATSRSGGGRGGILVLTVTLLPLILFWVAYRRR